MRLLMVLVLCFLAICRSIWATEAADFYLSPVGSDA